MYKVGDKYTYLVLVQSVKNNGPNDLSNLRICGNDFENSQYTNGERYIILYVCILLYSINHHIFLIYKLEKIEY